MLWFHIQLNILQLLKLRHTSKIHLREECGWVHNYFSTNYLQKVSGRGYLRRKEHISDPCDIAIYFLIVMLPLQKAFKPRLCYEFPSHCRIVHLLWNSSPPLRVSLGHGNCLSSNCLDEQQDSNFYSHICPQTPGDICQVLPRTFFSHFLLPHWQNEGPNFHKSIFK